MSDPTSRDLSSPADAPEQAAEPTAQEADAGASVVEASTPPAVAAPEGVVPEPGSHPVLRYTLARLGILVAVIAVLWLLGLRQPLLLLAFGFLISGVIAMVALDRSREGAAYGITSAIRNANAKIDASSRAEDDDVAEPAATSSAGHESRASTSTTAPPSAVATPSGTEPAAPLDDWDDPAPR